MEALELLPIASMTLLGAATAVRCRLFGQRWRQRRQQDGVQWCGALQNLVMHLQRHRGLSSMWLNGDRSVGPRLHAEREQANQHMHTLAQLPDSHLSAADVLPRAQWERFCADWRALCAELEQLDAADSIARHTELISQALNWLRAIGEASLSAGPQDHGWVSALVDQLPALSEALGQARAISMAADGKTPVRTIMEIAKARGMATGLVTTSGITDATPAAFAAHLANRADEASAAEQELALGVDVLMGGRRQFFLPESAGGKRKDGRNLIDEARNSGYAVALNADELRAAPRGRVLGLFNMSNMSYEIDRMSSGEPSLAEMTGKALDVLARERRGFLAMIEGGRIDHAAHANDAPAMIRDTLAFDEAVGVAMDFAKTHPDTLLIVTADHETGGLALIGHSKESKNYVGIDLKAIEKANASFQKIVEQLGEKPTVERIKDVVRQTLAVELTDAEAATVANDTLKMLDPYNYSSNYVHSLGFVLRPYLRVGWGSQTHTASPLLLFGSGPGARKIGGLMHNTEVFTVMKTAIGVR